MISVPQLHRLRIDKPDRLRKRVRQLKPIRPSRSDELNYRVELINLTKEVIRKTEVALLKIINDGVFVADSAQSNTNAKDMLIVEKSRIFDRIKSLRDMLRVARAVALNMATESNRRVLANVDKRLDAEISRLMAINIAPLIKSVNISKEFDESVRRNVELIESIPKIHLDRVENHVRRAFESGVRHEALATVIAEVGQISLRRAALIARDQIAKANSDFNRVRQQAIGIEKYVWITSRDERVRDTHEDNDGKIFSWNDPPEATGHPGEDINCRCTASPFFDLDESVG